MIRTGTPVSVLENERDEVIMTLIDLLVAEDAQAAGPVGVDLDDPATIPPEWL